MERSNANPAALMRQARKSMTFSPAEEEARPLAPRSRRVSAPADYSKAAEDSPASAPSSASKQAWRAICKTRVRTQPNQLGMKISDLSEGSKVAAAVGSSPEKGWLAISEPKGFVQVEDLVEASPIPSPREEPEPVRAPRSARRSCPDVPSTAQRVLGATSNRSAQSPRLGARSPRMSATGSMKASPSDYKLSKVSPQAGGRSRASPKATPSPQASSGYKTSRSPQADLQSRERERQLDLREKEQVRKEIQAIEHEREVQRREMELEKEQAAKEIRQMKEQAAKEMEKMQEKLTRAREAVSIAVGSIDTLYDQQDAYNSSTSTRLSSSTLDGSAEGDSRLIPEELFQAKVQAEDAGERIDDVLSMYQAVDQENIAVASVQKKADESKEASRVERSPLCSRNLAC